MKYSITIKSGLRYWYEAKNEEDAILKFIDDQKKSDEAHALKNNYKCRKLNYRKMITEVYEEVHQEDSC